MSTTIRLTATETIVNGRTTTDHNNKGASVRDKKSLATMLKAQLLSQFEE